MMMRRTIILNNILLEDVFQWYYDSIICHGGDGNGVIVCKNYRDASQFFVDWYCKKYKKTEFFHVRDEYENIVDFHDGNENFMFTDDPNINMFDYDYIFIIGENCTSFDNQQILLGVNSES